MHCELPPLAPESVNDTINRRAAVKVDLSYSGPARLRNNKSTAVFVILENKSFQFFLYRTYNCLTAYNEFKNTYSLINYLSSFN